MAIPVETLEITVKVDKPLQSCDAVRNRSNRSIIHFISSWPNHLKGGRWESTNQWVDQCDLAWGCIVAMEGPGFGLGDSFEPQVDSVPLFDDPGDIGDIALKTFFGQHIRYWPGR